MNRDRARRYRRINWRSHMRLVLWKIGLCCRIPDQTARSPGLPGLVMTESAANSALIFWKSGALRATMCELVWGDFAASYSTAAAPVPDTEAFDFVPTFKCSVTLPTMRGIRSAVSAPVSFLFAADDLSAEVIAAPTPCSLPCECGSGGEGTTGSIKRGGTEASWELGWSAVMLAPLLIGAESPAEVSFGFY